MTPWKTVLLLEPLSVKLLVKDARGKDLLKAELPLPPAHPRALVTLLEGLALWSRPPLSTAIAVDDAVPPGQGDALLGDDLWPDFGPLVQLELIEQEPGDRRMTGVGDFRPLRRLLKRGAA
jgi:hypothetical protein